MDAEAVLSQFNRLAVWGSRDQRAPHKPLLVLYALGRWCRGGRDAVALADVDCDLTGLLKYRLMVLLGQCRQAVMGTRCRPNQSGPGRGRRRSGPPRSAYRPNHHVVAPQGGEWADGLIEGDLVPVGWMATLGYPAFRPHAGGTAVAVKVLTAPLLAAAWPDLDRFEGSDYRRILVPVFRPGPADGRRLHTVANVYAAVEGG